MTRLSMGPTVLLEALTAMNAAIGTLESTVLETPESSSDLERLGSLCIWKQFVDEVPGGRCPVLTEVLALISALGGLMFVTELSCRTRGSHPFADIGIEWELCGKFLHSCAGSPRNLLITI
ncbi:hypothetical protein Aph01nite_35760 [Acrocarpospora phusangensis]|uniref:Uncharacterized protein n=1 Tax=Acrocarpospora phusangensis TaxID=1070424 RepID=A0A919QC32_9ACTN|nr:hypothetical protein Aph01nite_35760 [Acrocarpospora phusangensis]